MEQNQSLSNKKNQSISQKLDYKKNLSYLSYGLEGKVSVNQLSEIVMNLNR